MIRAFCFLAAVWLALPSAALEPDRREVVVIHARVWEGDTYREVFVPSTHSEMTLISGAASALGLVETLEYYWPLSRQVYVDFEAHQIELDALLTIRADGQEVAQIRPELWSILFPEGAIQDKPQILWGARALQEYEMHLADQATFNRRMSEAQRAHSAYERQLLEAGARRQEGAPPEVVPPPPPLPQTSLRLVTEPRLGYRIDLPPGRYELSFTRDGRPVPGADKSLHVVDGTAPRAVVADVVPEERWTRPILSKSSRARLYARPGATVFLTLSEATQMDEATYLAATSPQARAVPGRGIWVRRGEAGVEDVSLTWQAGDPAQQVVRTALKVDQTRGSGFGYRIRNATDGETPDLQAFQIPIPTDRTISRGRVEALPVAFAVDIVVVHPRDSRAGFLWALLPILGFAAIRTWRWRRDRATQSDD